MPVPTLQMPAKISVHAAPLSQSLSSVQESDWQTPAAQEASGGFSAEQSRPSVPVASLTQQMPPAQEPATARLSSQAPVYDELGQ